MCAYFARLIGTHTSCASWACNLLPTGCAHALDALDAQRALRALDEHANFVRLMGTLPSCAGCGCACALPAFDARTPYALHVHTHASCTRCACILCDCCAHQHLVSLVHANFVYLICMRTLSMLYMQAHFAHATARAPSARLMCAHTLYD